MRVCVSSEQRKISKRTRVRKMWKKTRLCYRWVSKQGPQLRAGDSHKDWQVDLRRYQSFDKNVPQRLWLLHLHSLLNGVIVVVGKCFSWGFGKTVLRGLRLWSGRAGGSIIGYAAQPLKRVFDRLKVMPPRRYNIYEHEYVRKLVHELVMVQWARRVGRLRCAFFPFTFHPVFVWISLFVE